MRSVLIVGDHQNGRKHLNDINEFVGSYFDWLSWNGQICADWLLKAWLNLGSRWEWFHEFNFPEKPQGNWKEIFVESPIYLKISLDYLHLWGYRYSSIQNKKSYIQILVLCFFVCKKCITGMLFWVMKDSIEKFYDVSYFKLLNRTLLESKG